MSPRLRALIERPLDPAVARLVVLLGGAVCVGFAALVGAGLLGPGPTSSRSSEAPVPGAREAAATARPVRPARPRPSSDADLSPRPRQDPQDRPGRAARRAHLELASHLALQHVPYRTGGVSIELVGAKGSKAVLEVRARGIEAARRGWREFLRRFEDTGAAYLPLFRGQREARPQATPGTRRPARREATPTSAAKGEFPHGTAESRDGDLPRSPRHIKADQ